MLNLIFGKIVAQEVIDAWWVKWFDSEDVKFLFQWLTIVALTAGQQYRFGWVTLQPITYLRCNCSHPHLGWQGWQ